MVVDSLISSGHEIVEISYDQMYDFAGNMLALRSNDGRDLVVLSQRAYESLRGDQVEAIGKYCEMLPIAIPTIETVGGGSVRCMICEIFLKPRDE